MQASSVFLEIRGILRAIRSKAPLGEILQRIVEGAGRLSDAGHGAFFQVTDAGTELELASHFGLEWHGKSRRIRFGLDEGLPGAAATSGDTYLCHNCQTRSDCRSDFPNVGSALALPVFVDQSVWGVITLDSPDAEGFAGAIVEEIELFAELASSAIDVHLKWERERQLQREVLEADKHASLGKLIAGVAHEINNPLTSVVGSAAILRQQLAAPEALELLEAVENGANRAGDLVRQLMNFSHRPIADTHEFCDLNQVVREACELIRPQLRITETTLEITQSLDRLMVSVNATQIHQVLINLITNSQQTIESRQIEDGRIHVKTDADDDHAYIQISDNAGGMDPRVCERIFEAFFTTRQQGEGTGLGLTVVKEIVEAHGGEIRCRSVDGDSTLVCFRLPLACQPGEITPDLTAPSASEGTLTEVSEPEPSRSAPEHDSEAEGRILVVDDEKPIRELLKRFLEGQGYAVDLAHTGEEAAKLAREQGYSLIISDVHMPGMNGADLYDQLIAAGLQPSRFVLITGDLTAPEVRRVIEGNICPVIPKPFKPHLLLYHLPCNQATLTAGT